MNDADLDALVAAASRPSRERVEAIVASAPLAELREAILATSPGVTTTGLPAGAGTDPIGEGDAVEVVEAIDLTAPLRRSGRHGVGRWRPRRAAVLVAAGVVLCAVVAGAVGLGRGGDEPGGTEVWSSEALQVAAEVPTLLLSGSEWRVTEVVGFSPEEGELRFRSADTQEGPDAGAEAELHWRAAAGHERYVADREASSAGPGEAVEVAGHEGVLFQYDSPEPDSTVLWLDGDHSLELRAPVPRDEMRTLAGSLVAVDANTWLDALPPEVVRADSRATAVAGMVADIPLPPGFDLRSLQEGDLAGDRYDLGVEVTQAITCAWIREWEAATAAGNAAQADAAEAALATAPDWAILHEMDREGGWSDYVREWAAAGAAGTGSTPHGQPIGTFCTNR